MIRFRADVEGLRAVAVFLVIFNHLAFRGFRGGFVGVDVFFVISGYLITSLLAAEYAERDSAHPGRGSISIGHFYLRRARRILPAALAVVAAVVLAAHLLLNSLRVQQVEHDAWWAALFGSNVNFIRQANDYFAASSATGSPFRHYWSLAVEEQFYLVWPAVFLVVVGLHGLKFRGIHIGWRHRLLAALSAIAVVSLIWSIQDTATNPTSSYFSTFTRSWELALGALIGIATTRATVLGRRQTTAAAVTGVLLLVVGCFVTNSSSAFPGYVALLPTVGAALLIIAGITDSPPLPNRLISIAPMRFLGRISYSLYLWHWPLIVFAALLYPHASAKLSVRFVILGVAIAVATVSYYAIERPFRRVSVEGGRVDRARVRFERSGLTPALSAAAPVSFLLVVLIPLFYFAVRSQRTSVYVPVAETGTAFEVRATNLLPPASLAGTISGTGAYARLLARWQAKVKAGLAVKSLPEHDRPISEHVASSSNPCDHYRLDIAQHEDECSWGSPDAQNVAAITGDSHAGMWLSTLEGALDPQKWRVFSFTRSWCGWSGFIPEAGDGANKDCPALQSQTVSELRRLHVDLLILSQAQVPSQGPMVQALLGFASVAKHVVVLGQTPVVVPSFIQCLKGDSDISHCSGMLSSGDFATIDRERYAAAVVKDPFIDTTPWFCFKLTCPPVIDDAPAFADGSHISTSIATLLIPLLRQELRQDGVL